MCLPSDCRGEDGNRNLMTKVMRKSGEKPPKSSLAAFYLSIHPSKSLPIQPIKFSRLVVAIEIFYYILFSKCVAVLLSNHRAEQRLTV